MGEEMEANTCYLGIELNDSYAMVSYMQPNMEEPETVSTIAGSENYRIPTLLARRKMSACGIMGKMPEGWQRPVR